MLGYAIAPDVLVTTARDAEPEQEMEVYRSRGPRLTYDPYAKTVRADVDPAAHRWDSICV